MTTIFEQAPGLGREPTEKRGVRDAVHIHVAEAKAYEELQPGQRVGFADAHDPRLFGVVDEPIGVVDPYLTEPVPEGGWFWMFLLPEYMGRVVHRWTAEPFEQRKSVQEIEAAMWMDAFTAAYDFESVGFVLQAARRFRRFGSGVEMSERGGAFGAVSPEEWKEFWRRYDVLEAGEALPDDHPDVPFWYDECKHCN